MVYSSIGTVSLMPKTCTVFVSALLELTCPFPSSETLAAVPPAPVSPSGAGPDGHPAWCDAAHHAIDQSALTRGERGKGRGWKTAALTHAIHPPCHTAQMHYMYVHVHMYHQRTHTTKHTNTNTLLCIVKYRRDLSNRLALPNT